MNSEIVKAIQYQNLLKFYYDGGDRIVEPHCYGTTTAGNEGLRAYQVSGHTTSGKMGWKMFDMGKAKSIEALDETFDGPRSGYKSGDRGMSRIISEL